MKAFIKGFAKGIAGCICVLACLVLFCSVTGVFDRNKEEAPASADVEAVSEEEISSQAEVDSPKDTETIHMEKETTEETLEETAEETAADAEVLPESTPIRILFAGDVYLPESHQTMYLQDGIHALVEPKLNDMLIGADLFVINQEFPFGTTGQPAEDKQFTFRLHPQYVNAELDLGVDLVTLANNHVLDFGREPLEETLAVLQKAGIAYVGAGSDLQEACACKTFTIGETTIGFLGASRVIPVADWNAGKDTAGVLTTYDPARLVEEIKKAKEACDFVVVYVHWGIERNTSPEDYQRNLGRMYIEAGADAVIGSHPHVLQGIEYHQGKPIVYSLGNFIFNTRTYDTMLAELTLLEENCTLRLIPCISENGTVRLNQDRPAFMEMMKILSFEVNIDEDGIVLP